MIQKQVWNKFDSLQFTADLLAFSSPVIDSDSQRYDMIHVQITEKSLLKGHYSAHRGIFLITLQAVFSSWELTIVDVPTY